MSDAAATFSLEDDSLSAGLSSIAAQFEKIASQINAGFSGANAQLTQTAAATRAIGAGAGPIQAMASALQLAARTSQMVTTGLAGAVKTAATLAPLAKFIPDSFGKWAPPVKAAAAEITTLSARVGVVTKSFGAVTGRLTTMNAAMMALQLREVGATRGMAALGAAGALATSKMIAGARGAIGSITALGNAAGAAATKASNAFRGIAGGLGRGIAGAGSVLAPMAGLAVSLGPLGASILGMAGAVGVLGKSMSSAADMQGMEASFATLLGSMDAARGRMAELSKFAASTPFEIPQVADASRVLETLTGGALSTGAGLRLVGDVAANVGEPFDQLAVHIGRLYQGLMDGRPVGEAMSRLQELGAITPQTRSALEDLQKTGAKGGGLWAKAAADLSRFSGEMKRQSGTWNGMMSNLADTVGNAFRALGAPLIEAFSPFLSQLIDGMAGLAPMAQRFGQVVAGMGGTLMQVFASGQMSKAIELAAKIGLMEGANFFAGAIMGTLRMLGAGVVATFENAVRLLSIATTADFWKGVGSALKAAVEGMVALLTRGLSEVFAGMRDLPIVGEKAGKAANALAGISASLASNANEDALSAIDRLAPAFAAIGESMLNTWERISTAFEEGQKQFGSVFDSSELRRKLVEMFSKASADAAVASAQLKAALAKGGLPGAVKGGGGDDTGTGMDSNGGERKQHSYLARIGGGGYQDLSSDRPTNSRLNLSGPVQSNDRSSDPLLNVGNQQLATQKVMVERLTAIEKHIAQAGQRRAPAATFG